MQITIHRATQIGGQITSISTNRVSIIIDLGHNLPNHTENEDAYDNDSAIAGITEGCSAILYTHYHGDHIGLFHHVPDNIPQYIGEVAKQVVCRKYKQLCFLRDLSLQQKYRHAQHEQVRVHFAERRNAGKIVCLGKFAVKHPAHHSENGVNERDLDMPLHW